MQAETEPSIDILPTTHWADIQPNRSCFEEIKNNVNIQKLVPKIQSIVNDAKDKATQLSYEDDLPVQNLSEDEMFAVVAYTHDLQQEKREGNLYFELNKALRTRGVERQLTIQPWNVFVHFIMAALDKLPNFEGIVYRGCPDKEVIMTKYKKGRPIQWGAFTSTSTNKEAAKRFAEKKGVVFKIDVLNGKDINAFSFFPIEGEIILSPNCRFTVTKAAYDDNGFTFVDLFQQEGRVMTS